MDSVADKSIEGDPLPPAGARFGPYLLGERIGRGGMAVVYKAKIEGPGGFEKPVVLKLLLPALTAKPEFLEMFTSEAKTTAQLSHPGIVHVYDFGLLGATPYLVMEYLDGIDLSRLIALGKMRTERVPVDIAVVIVTQVCNALGYAHQFRDAQGQRLQIIHGDVSPSNVMVCRDGSVKLLDFGVSRVMGEFDFHLSHQLKGKFAYMAPEQVRRQPFDRRVDVFAAGITLYELLTAQRLFFGPSDRETLKRVHAARVEPPSKFNPDVSPELDAVVLKALKRDPGDRWESGDEMATALMAVSRIGRGRQRVADYFAYLTSRAIEGEVAVEPSRTETVKADPPALAFFADAVAPQPLTAFVPPPPVVTGPAVAAPPAKKRRPPTITMLVRPLITLEHAPRKRSRLLVALAVALGGLTVGSLAGIAQRIWTTRGRDTRLILKPVEVKPIEARPVELPRPTPPAAATATPVVTPLEPVVTPLEPTASPAAVPAEPPLELRHEPAPVVVEPVVVERTHHHRHRRAPKSAPATPTRTPAPTAPTTKLAPASAVKGAPTPHRAPTRKDEPRRSVKDGELVDPYGAEGDE
jgi:serine/threonine-protein kinase